MTILLLNQEGETLTGRVGVRYTFHLKNHSRTDYDNLIKPLQDILVKRGFIEDDRKIYECTVKKVASDTDRIEVEFYPLTD